MYSPPVHPYSLAQLTYNRVNVYAVCQHCGHFKALDAVELCKQFGGQTLVVDVQRRMKCDTCWRKKCELVPDRPQSGERVCPRCGRTRW